MDTPGVKAPYSAVVQAPSWCTVLMSALSEDIDVRCDNAANVSSRSDNAKSTFRWRQPVPTSSYLVALAAGKLEYRDISRRVRVWAEPVSLTKENGIVDMPSWSFD
jgi:leukotriene-A4 hydrolase